MARNIQPEYMNTRSGLRMQAAGPEDIQQGPVASLV